MQGWKQELMQLYISRNGKFEYGEIKDIFSQLSGKYGVSMTTIKNYFYRHVKKVQSEKLNYVQEQFPYPHEVEVQNLEAGENKKRDFSEDRFSGEASIISFLESRLNGISQETVEMVNKLVSQYGIFNTTVAIYNVFQEAEVILLNEVEKRLKTKSYI